MSYDKVSSTKHMEYRSNLNNSSINDAYKSPQRVQSINAKEDETWKKLEDLINVGSDHKVKLQREYGQSQFLPSTYEFEQSKNSPNT